MFKKDDIYSRVTFDSILFNNGTHFSATNVVINQKWSK